MRAVSTSRAGREEVGKHAAFCRAVEAAARGLGLGAASRRGVRGQQAWSGSVGGEAHRRPPDVRWNALKRGKLTHENKR